MIDLKPQYIKDADGINTMVILTANEFNLLISELEELEDIRLYDEAKKHDDGERIPMDEAFKMIEAKRFH